MKFVTVEIVVLVHAVVLVVDEEFVLLLLFVELEVLVDVVDVRRGPWPGAVGAVTIWVYRQHV